MEKLASSVSTEEETHIQEPEDEVTEDRDLTKLRSMVENGNFQEAFFYARRLVAQGESWAEEWMSKTIKIHFEGKICNRARNSFLHGFIGVGMNYSHTEA